MLTQTKQQRDARGNPMLISAVVHYSEDPITGRSAQKKQAIIELADVGRQLTQIALAVDRLAVHLATVVPEVDSDTVIVESRALLVQILSELEG